MHGYWYIIAFAVGMSGLSIMLDNYFFILLYFLWLFYLFYSKRLSILPLVMSLVFSLFFLFYIPSKSQDTGQNTTSINQESEVVGKVVTQVLKTERKLEFTLKGKNKIIILYFFNDNSDNSTRDHQIKSTIKYGAICKVSGKVQLPQESRNPGQFDYRDYLLSKGISHQIIVHSLNDIVCNGSSPINSIYSVREKLIDNVRLKFNSGTGDWLNALIFGDKSSLNEEIIALFQRWGLSHLLAISGLHVGLMIGIIYFILIKLNILPKEKVHWIMIFFLPIYALLAGGEPSVLRASGMVLIFIILNKMNLKLGSTDILSIIFLLLILFDKYVIYHIGFQFSFIVSLGLILSRRMIANIDSSFFKILTVSFISQMMILPIQVNYFFIFQPLSIFINTLIVPYFSIFVIPYMFFSLVLLPLPSIIIEFFDYLFIVINEKIILLLGWIDKFFNDPFVIGDFPVIYSIIYYFFLLIMMKKFQENKLTDSFKYGIFLCVVVIFIFARPYISPFGNVTMLDIGQGDAFVIELPFRRGVFMIDAGAHFSFSDFTPSDKVYNQIIKQYLYSRGIQQIDAVFISHKDIDHMGSLQNVIKEFNVKQLLIGQYYDLDEEEIRVLKQNKTKVRRVGANELIKINNHSFIALSPLNNEHSKNDNSLVLYSKIGGMRWLFTGDIGKDIERKISGRYKNLPVDILKVAHHGSNTSTDLSFLEHVRPTYAFISVGAGNSYGHPAKEVIESLESKNIKIFRTDQDGAVQYWFRKNEGTFKRHLP